jgi:glycosyltransferase involved in cell wall biosynthesis
MKIAHLGSHMAQQGGPAGYLRQLQRAFAAFGTDGCEVLLPAPAPSSSQAVTVTAGQRLRQQLRRVRRHVGAAPAQFRPPLDTMMRAGGPAHDLLASAWRDLRANIGSSLEGAMAARADVLFAHDAPSAEAALERREDGQQVWLFIHTPMPLALYLTWSWGVPEVPWPEIAAWPDVQEWTQREAAVIGRVDKVLLPCREALDEFAWIDAGFAAGLHGAEFLLTGVDGPERHWPDASNAEVRKRFGLPLNVPVVLFLGNAQPYRGLDALTAAIAHLPSSHDVPGVVAIAGPPVDVLPLSRRIQALGPVKEVGDLLSAVDALINVNRFSLFDLSTIEALESGCALVLHATGGNHAFDRLGAGTVMMHSLEPRAVADALTRVFTMGLAERVQLRQRSRQCYESHTTLRHLRDRHLAAYLHSHVHAHTA